MSKKLTRHKSNITIVTADFANSIYGGLNQVLPIDVPEEDPLVAGHIHDGAHLDGYAQKINLSDHVDGELDGQNVKDGTITSDKLNFSVEDLNLIVSEGCCKKLMLTVDGRLVVDLNGEIIFKQEE